MMITVNYDTKNGIMLFKVIVMTTAITIFTQEYLKSISKICIRILANVCGIYSYSYKVI